MYAFGTAKGGRKD